MDLTPEETERAAKLLCETSLNKPWADQNENEQTGFKMVVTELAAKLDTPHSDAAVAVFMAWMGDDVLMGELKEAKREC